MKDHEYMNLLITRAKRKKQILRQQIKKIQREIGVLSHEYNEMRTSLEDSFKHQSKNSSEKYVKRVCYKRNYNVLVIGSILILTYFYTSVVCAFVITAQETINFITISNLIMQLLFCIIYLQFVYV